jgi:four helix bundle protein
MNIALKEANETEYWLSLLKNSEYITGKEYRSLSKDVNELISMLVSTVKTLKK